jgi:type I restriction enzyme, S subunit
VNELPPNWALVRVGDIVELGPKNDCPDDTEVGFVPLQRLGVNYRSRHTFEPKLWSVVKNGYTHFADGDVLLARITPSFENGKAGIVRGLPNGIGAGSTEYFVCRPIEGALLPEYLLAHFKTPEFLRDGEQVMSGAVGQQRVPKQYVLESELHLAPFNEQKRIADKLDAILAQVDACRERLDRVPAILKRFRQAVLATATSGKLTEVWREDQVSDDWQTVSVEAVASEVFDGPFGSNLKSKDYSETGVRVVRLENIGWLNFIADKETFIRQEKYETLRKHTLRAKDVLFSSFVAEEVRVCLLPDDLSEQTINKADCFCVRPDPIICLPEFLALRLACRSTFLALEQEIHGATRPRINLSQLKEFRFELPALSEQHEIVRRVEALFAYADRLEARYTAASTQVECLTPALLAKAFRGELVSQDPNDEPASVLLERIRAVRAEQPTVKRRRKPSARGVPRAPREKAAMTKSRQDDDVLHKPYLAGLLRESGGITSVEDLFRRAELPVSDFYKQLAWEVENGHIRDDETRLEAA